MNKTANDDQLIFIVEKIRFYIAECKREYIVHLYTVLNILEYTRVSRGVYACIFRMVPMHVYVARSVRLCNADGVRVFSDCMRAYQGWYSCISRMVFVYMSDCMRV